MNACVNTYDLIAAMDCVNEDFFDAPELYT